jgi:hypothetical protein
MQPLNNMSSSFDTALKARDAGRGWSVTPGNLVKRVQITDNPDNLANWAHLVFSLDKSFLRPSATGFEQFREDSSGLSMLKSFSFFVQMIYQMQKAGSDTPGQNMAVFFEWVKHATSDKHVAIRLHVFSNRKGKDTGAMTIVKDMIDNNIKQIESNIKRKTKIKEEEHVFYYDSWQSVSSLSEYARQVADVYLRNHQASSSLDDPQIDNATHKINPLFVFRLEAKAFNHALACPLQNVVGNYRNDEGKFVFPDETRIYRVMPSDLHLDKFFHRYLPDFFFTRIKFPDVRMENPNADGCKAYVTPHLDRERYAKYLSQFEHVDNDTWNIPLMATSDFQAKMSEHFNVWTNNNEANATAVTGSTANWVDVTPVMNEYCFHDQSIAADSIPVVSPLVKTLLTDKHSLSDIDVLKIRAQYLSEWVFDRRELQEKIVEMFVERVWDDEHADVSEPAKMMLTWKTHLRQPQVYNFKKIDPKMSIFANRAIRIMEVFDKVLMVSAAHKTLFLLVHSMLNAYDQVLGLHFNQIYTGEGATSKSFLFVVAKVLAIQGTCESLTYQTTRADAVDGDLIDQITIFEEAPPGMFFTSKTGDRTQESMFKEKLTSQVVKCKEFWRDENTGERKNRTAKSQCIGVCMGATNDNPADCSEAMRTRFYWGAFEKVTNGRDIQTCQRGEREQEECPEALKIKRFWIEYFRDQQLKVWAVFKFMYMDILKRPTLKAADIVYAQVTEKLRRDFKVNVPPRTKERYEILCTVFTIVNALEKVFNIDGGIHACAYKTVPVMETVPKLNADGTVVKDDDGNVELISQHKEDEQGLPMFEEVAVPNDFQPIQLLDIEPYLVCDEEIALFAMTQISEEIVNPDEFKVLKALWKIHKERLDYKEDLVTQGDERVAEKNYSYVKLHSGNRLLVEIANSIPPSAGKMSPHNIQCILTDLKTRYVPSHSYLPAAAMNEDKITYTDGFVRPHELQKMLPQPKDNSLSSACMLSVENNHTIIHMDMFAAVRNGVDVQKIKESIKALEHKFALKERKMILGCSQRGSHSGVIHPSLFDVVELRRNESRQIRMINPIHMNEQTRIIHGVKEISKQQRHKAELISYDLSIKSALTHAETLKIPQREYVKEYLECKQEYESVDTTINYPADMITPSTHVAASDHNEDYTEEYEFSMDEFDVMPARKRARHE